MDDIIRLNIGGKIFETTLQTLKTKGENLLTNTIIQDRESGTSAASPVIKDSSGSYFFDRSPDLFKIILEYLRNGEMYEDFFVSRVCSFFCNCGILQFSFFEYFLMQFCLIYS